MIAEAFRRSETVHAGRARILIPEALLPAAAFELARKALERARGKYSRFIRETGGTRSKMAHSSKPRFPATKSHRLDPEALPRAVRRRKSRNQNAWCRRNRAPRDLLEILLESEAAAIVRGREARAFGSSSGGGRGSGARRIRRSGCWLTLAAENTLRVDAGRIDTVMNLVGELIIGKSMLQRAIAEFERAHAKDSLRGKFVRRSRVSIPRARRAAKIRDEDPHGSGRTTFPPVSAHRARRGQDAQ